MSADDHPNKPAPVAEATTTPTNLVTIMRGGTVSSSHEAHLAAIRADSIARRAQQDEERIAAQRAATAHEVAGRNTLDMGMPSTHPVVVIQILSRDGTKERYAQCDLILMPSTTPGQPDELVLNVPCPRCLDRGVPADQVAMQIRQSHRKFYLDEKYKGQVWIDPDPPHEVFTLAGKVHGPEIYKCAAAFCDYKFRINGTVDTGHPAISRMQREW